MILYFIAWYLTGILSCIALHFLFTYYTRFTKNDKKFPVIQTRTIVKYLFFGLAGGIITAFVIGLTFALLVFYILSKVERLDGNKFWNKTWFDPN